MTNHNQSPAALRRIAIVFASLCCSAGAIGAAAPLFASSSNEFAGRSTKSAVANPANAASEISKDSTDA